MKKIIILIGFLALICNAKSQNEMMYTNYVYNGVLKVLDTNTIDITYLKNNSLITTTIANNLIEYINTPMIVNTLDDKRGVCQVFYSNGNWGTSLTNAYLSGNYSSGNINQANLFDLYFSNNERKRYELILRLRNELEGNLSNLIDSVCIGLDLDEDIKVGYYQGELNNNGVFMDKSGDIYFVIINTICKANELEIERRF